LAHLHAAGVRVRFFLVLLPEASDELVAGLILSLAFSLIHLRIK
jgi:ABC-type spermidine/putrescine transport system permease subunit II